MARLDAAVDEIVFDGPVKYTLAQLAEKSGTSIEQVESLSRWFGRPSRGPDEFRYTDSDVKALQTALVYARAEQLPDEAAASLVRGISSAMQRLAARQVETIIHNIAAAHRLSDTDARLTAAKIAPPQAAMVLPLIDHIYRRHFAAAVHRLTTGAIAQRGLYDDEGEYPLLRAVGFADLVSFTERTEKATAAQFSQLVRTFTDTCWEIVSDGGGQIVNFIGDAVFFAADDVQIGAQIALQLAAPNALPNCGPVRVGMVWTRVLSVYGDVFGPGVNLAARLASQADPGDVFVGPKSAEVLRRSRMFSVVDQPVFEAHGIGPVTPARLRYADDPR